MEIAAEKEIKYVEESRKYWGCTDRGYNLKQDVLRDDLSWKVTLICSKENGTPNLVTCREYLRYSKK